MQMQIFCIYFSYVLYIVINIQIGYNEMVKKQKKCRVWEKQKPKIRKKRTIVKIYEEQQSDDQEEQISIKDNQLLVNQKPISQQQLVQHQNLSHQSSSINKQSSIPLIHPKIDYQQQKRKHQESLIVNKIMLRSQQTSFENQYQCGFQRPEQKQKIINFLLNSQLRTSPDWLYLYGSPGIGKTYIIKNLLKILKLQQTTIWNNCYSIISRSQLKVPQNYGQNQQGTKRIVILDEFDQLQSYLDNKKFITKFRQFIYDLSESLLIRDVSQIKYVLISNKSYRSLHEKSLQTVKDIMQCERIIEVAFLPYSLQSVKKIMQKRISQVQLQFPHLIFKDNLVQITISKLYSSSQDIRKIISFIVQNYQSLLQKQHQKNEIESENYIKNKNTFIDQLVIKKHEHQQEINLICNYLKHISGLQKQLLKNIILLNDQAQKQKEQLKLSQVYKQGKKLRISNHTVDVWIQEWIQMQFFSKKEMHPRFQHYLYKPYVIKPLLTMSQYRKYFY